jgi:S1-C subfamily serine protease
MFAAVRLLAPLAVVFLTVTGVRADDEPKPTGYVGIALKPADDGKGFAIQMVREGSPAEKAGLKAEDVILKLNGKEVEDVNKLVSQVKMCKPGDKLTFTIKRDGKEQEIKVTVGDPPKTDG